MEPEILYEDNMLIVCVKPAGMPSQDDHSSAMDMASWLKNHTVKGDGKQPPYIGVVHRLDRPVGGVMVYAKTPQAARDCKAKVPSIHTKKAATRKAYSCQNGYAMRPLRMATATHKATIPPYSIAPADAYCDVPVPFICRRRTVMGRLSEAKINTRTDRDTNSPLSDAKAPKGMGTVQRASRRTARTRSVTDAVIGSLPSLYPTRSGRPGHRPAAA